MQLLNGPAIQVENHVIDSLMLARPVVVDFYLPTNVADPSRLNLLLINDGQNLADMNFQVLLEELCGSGQIEPLLCAGIHAGQDRKMEYGVSSTADYLGRGARAGAYSSFLIQELMPFITGHFAIPEFKTRAVAGFSLGGLMALDIAWNHPSLFSRAGVFSGSFWWRSVDQEAEGYDDYRDRIMLQEIRAGRYSTGLKFFFQCGNQDETMDRNQNGIIDSIDDTMAVIDELAAKGYDRTNDIMYLEMPDGRHDIATWGLAMPTFLKWGWGSP